MILFLTLHNYLHCTQNHLLLAPRINQQITILKMSRIHLSFVFNWLFSLVVTLLIVQNTCAKISETGDEKITKEINLENNLTSSGIRYDYIRNDDSYKNVIITSLRALIISPDMHNRFGRISYKVVTQKGMLGIRLEFQEMKFSPKSIDGTCYPCFFMILKDDIASGTYCGDFSSFQHDIMSKEGSVVELLMINQTPYMNNEPAKWRILISQIPKNNIVAQPLMEAEKDSCGMKSDDPPDESSRTEVPDLSQRMNHDTWTEPTFEVPACRLHQKSACRAIKKAYEEYQSRNNSNKIVNGREAKTWPWMIGLGTFKDGRFRIFCGGSIVGRQFVATAAHCVLFTYHGIELKDVVVAVRAHDLSKKESRRQYISISKIMLNPEYFGVRNDIALLELSHPLDYDDKCSSICLPWNTDNADDQLEGSRVVITGWGLTSNYGAPSATLQEAAVRCIPNANCSANWIAVSGKDSQSLIESSMVCCGGKSATCHGDSGSPVHVQAPNGRWNLAGLVSFGQDYNCLDPRYVLSVHSRASYFMKWIGLSLAKPSSAAIVTYE